jgi:DNA mismatch repair ATPase MutS
VYPIINLVLMWDFHCVFALERWQRSAGKQVRGWFNTLGELEALSSLGGFAHDNPTYAWPKVEAERTCFEATELGHPLILKGRISNDIKIERGGRALLVTGSNMSGKSTLMRAIGINAVLAQAGAPVCARELTMGALSVRTSMRISDSLEQGVSHFYAELHKLKAVLDARGGEVPVLFLLDEVLHGTNSRERQIGARWVLAELLKAKAIGAISTHDSGLCTLPEPLMSAVQQVHLREIAEGSEMTFDYKLRSGPVQSGNALRLMRSLGIGVPLQDESVVQT